ncbi:hypothetical protein [Brevundimonas sp.]|uniref:hypothetical protein n=1 Tax=Brevundimonas sp. TaxID=1871086 RepID=UPI003D6C8701
MMNPLHNQPRDQIEKDSSVKVSEQKPTKQTGLFGWIRRHFGKEEVHRHSPNFFISDVTEGGIGSHHHHQVYRPDKRH